MKNRMLVLPKGYVFGSKLTANCQVIPELLLRLARLGRWCLRGIFSGGARQGSWDREGACLYATLALDVETDYTPSVLIGNSGQL